MSRNFSGDQTDARLYFLIWIEDHFSSRSSSQSHGQSLPQFSSLGFVSCTCLPALFELVQLSEASHAGQA
jgi:hypothetical protein